MADRSHSTVAILERAIAAKGLTLKQVAAAIKEWSKGRLQPTESQLVTWKKGQIEPTPVYVEALAAVLGLDLDSLCAELSNYWSQHRNHRKSTTMRGGSATQRVDLRAVSEMRRRRLLQLGGMAVGAGMAGGLAVPIDTEPLRLASAAGVASIGTGTLDSLEKLADHYVANYYDYAPGDLDQRLRAALVEVREHLERQPTLKDRARLYEAGAWMSMVHGRALFALGRVDEAGLHYNTAAELADQLDHAELLTWSLSEQAGLARYLSQPEVALDITEAILPTAQGDSRRYILSDRAWAAAELGDHAGTKAALRLIEGDIEESGHRPQSVMAQSVSGALACASSALLWLGEATLARRNAEHSLAAVVNTSQGVLGRAHANMVLSAAYAQLGEPDTALGIAEEVLTQDPPVSHAVRLRSRELRKGLERYQGEKIFVEFEDLMRAHGPGAPNPN